MRHGTPVRAKPPNDAEAVLLKLDPSTPGAALDAPATGWFQRGLAFWGRDWARSICVFAGCSLLLIWVFRSEIGAAVHVWRSSLTFGHGAFVFPITLFLFYRLRAPLAALRPGGEPWALVPIIGATLLWTIGELANVMVVKQFAFVVIWESLFLLVFGWQVCRATLFPLAYVYLAVPFGTSVIPILQHVTAEITVSLLRFTGVPVFLEGFHIEIPNGSFLVAEACSGVRYLIVCFALGVLVAYLIFRSWPRRILFIALSLLAPIIVNGLRAYSIVMVGYFGRYDLLADGSHVAYGFVLMSVGTFALLGLGALLHDGDISRAGMVGAPVPAGRMSVAQDRGMRGNLMQAGGAALAMAVVLSVHMSVLGAKAPPASVDAMLHAPAVSQPWAPEGGAPGWSPTFHGADATLQQGYRRARERVDLHVGYYAYQREGAEAVSDLNTIAGRTDLKVLSSRQVTIQIGDASLPINEFVIVYDDKRFVVWAWYRIGGEYTNSRQAGKFLEMKAFVTGGERAAAAIAVSAEISEDVKGTVDLLNAFLQEGFGESGALFQVETSPAGAASGTP